MKILKCEICGNVVEVVSDSGMKLICCGKEMTELEPSSTDGVHEKHVPIPIVVGNKVTVMVGEIAHPMMDNHYIEWIAIKSTTGIHKTYLNPGQDPIAEFTLAADEMLIVAYAYCNLHGLWKSE